MGFNRNLIAHLMGKELRDRYGGTWLGGVWSFVQPLALMLMYGFVFSLVLGVRTGQEYTGVPFALWLLAGLIPWSFFSEGVTRSMTCVRGNAQLVTKSLFDKEALPLSAVLSAGFGHLVVLLCFIPAVFLAGRGPGWGVLYLPLAIIPMFLFTLAWGYLVSALNVYLRDTEQAAVIFLQFMFFLTPIAYPRGLAPDWAATLFLFNPFHHLISLYRETLLLGQTPGIGELAGVWGFCLICLVAARRMFGRLSPGFADLL